MTNTEYLKNVGMELKVARIRMDLSITQLAMLTGLNCGSLQRIERGKSDAKLLSLKRIADALSVSLKDIM